MYEHMFVPMPRPSETLELVEDRRSVARRLRSEGMPYKRIAKQVGASVSTVYAWTNDIQLTPAQIERNRTGPGGPANPADVRRRAYSWSRKCRNQRLARQREGRSRALDGDPIHLAGCLLYWAEGSKSKNVLTFSNSELPMVRLFRDFVTECFDVGPERFSLTLHVYLNNGLEIGEIEHFWLNGLDLPESVLRKHAIDPTPTSSSGRKRNKLPYGVCSLRVLRSSDILHHIYGAIQEYAGFDEPSWLR